MASLEGETFLRALLHHLVEPGRVWRYVAVDMVGTEYTGELSHGAFVCLPFSSGLSRYTYGSVHAFRLAATTERGRGEHGT